MAGLYIKTPWSYETDSWVDVTSVDFNSKNIYESTIFDRLDILQFFSDVSKHYKYVKTSQTWLGTLNDETLVYIKHFSLCLSMTYMHYILVLLYYGFPNNYLLGNNFYNKNTFCDWCLDCCNTEDGSKYKIKAICV